MRVEHLFIENLIQLRKTDKSNYNLCPFEKRVKMKFKFFKVDCACFVYSVFYGLRFYSMFNFPTSALNSPWAL